MSNNKKINLSQKEESHYIGIITPDEALSILKILLDSKKLNKQDFDQVAKEYVDTVTLDEIAEKIYFSLDEINLEDILYRAGRHSSSEHKYPFEIIQDDIEEILDPFVRKIDSFTREKLFYQANIYCKGILKGLHDFESNSKSEILSELPDGLYIIAEENIFNLWDKINHIEDSKSINIFIHNVLPNWDL